MPSPPFSGLVVYVVLLTIFLVSPVAAFGAGNVPTSSGLFGFNGRHGDIAALLLSIPTTAAASAKAKNLNMKRVYFGNWLRDYNQIMDLTMLQKAPEEVLRAVVSILGFSEFGFATREFDMTRERLGVYRPEEHIDNPRGYTDKAKKDDERLRGPVKNEGYSTDGIRVSIESLLGKIDDKMATGKLNELALRLPSGGSGDVASAIEALQTALTMGESIHLLPSGFSQNIQSLKSSPAVNGDQPSTWQEVNKHPSGIWNAIEPFFRIRDDIVKWLQESGPDLSIFTIAIAEISEAIDKMVFAALAEIVGPILGDVREQLEVEKEHLLKGEKAASEDPESDIFSSGSKATNPIHSQIAKDHFDCVLNIPAAQVAAILTSFATERILDCWNNPSIDAGRAITTPTSPKFVCFKLPPNGGPTKAITNATSYANHLAKSTIADDEHKYLIKDPDQWHNLRPFGIKPAEDKSLVDTVIDNITDAVKQGIVDIPEQALREIADIMQSLPTPDIPNPVDVALSMMTEAMPVLDLFRCVSPEAIMAAPTMGNILKDVFSFW